MLILIPGMPKLPFLLAGGVLLFASLRHPGDEEPADPQAPALQAAGPAPDSLEALVEEIRVDPLEWTLSADLIDLVDSTAGGDLLDRVRRCAARSPPTSAWSCRRCAPATTSTSRCGPT